MNHAILAALLLTAASLAPVAARAELTANIGWASEYIYRGVPQKTASAFAGLDFERAGFYLGTWAADVGDGAEVDLYGGYRFEAGDFRFGVGATGYFYTGDFDDTYREINLSAGWGLLSLEYARGEYDNFDGPRQKYDFLELILEYQGFFAKAGTFGRDFAGDTAQVGYGFELAGLDLSLAWVWADKRLALNDGRDDHTLVFTLTKNFTLAD
jgi:uncharacterized protein (TIGR02001 family)